MGEKEEQPHLSGAYIRSLVKQLSNSSRAKGGDGSSMGSPNPENGENPKDNNINSGDKTKKSIQDRVSEDQNKAPTPHKKQVRRRLHTTRPYQERLLNMAEARREIVTALKVHRAAMKQAKEKQQQQHQQQMQLHQQQMQLPTLTQPSIPLFEPYHDYPLNYGTISNYLYNTNSSPFSYPSFSWPWSQPTIAPITPFLDNLNLDLPLPSQPLGLNLNFHGFNSINTSFSNNQSNKPLSQPSPTTSSNSHSCSSPTPQNFETSQFHQDQKSVSLHPVMDEEEMAEIYSIGEKHDIEWNDTVNLVTSAWWSKFLKSLEGEEEESTREGVESKGCVLDEASNAPTFFDDTLAQELNTANAFEEQLFGYYPADHMEDADLPQLDIGELEGWDGEWLS
ncbi:hypothetical protein LUZ63_006144 [Rhynchospora breviuscula]|uniref:Uncharacterized protein n=1 Tax=Rhynchospora breviuscula TaxID=2022672 RepID=A0A9Q0HT80_9POAL|nr:hypothetical protein LUZ63_006144 [Rhynchospora breviuscula]